jgi:hypothetical protein
LGHWEFFVVGQNRGINMLGLGFGFLA